MSLAQWFLMSFPMLTTDYESGVLTKTQNLVPYRFRIGLPFLGTDFASTLILLFLAPMTRFLRR